jgi:hypothetical protein
MTMRECNNHDCEIDEPHDYAPGSLEWMDIVEELRQLHLEKTSQYGSQKSAFANVEASEKCGVEPWRRAMCDISDCTVRMQNFCNGADDVDYENALKDLANWSLICLVMLRRERDEYPSADVESRK